MSCGHRQTRAGTARCPRELCGGCQLSSPVVLFSSRSRRALVSPPGPTWVPPCSWGGKDQILPAQPTPRVRVRPRHGVGAVGTPGLLPDVAFMAQELLCTGVSGAGRDSPGVLLARPSTVGLGLGLGLDLPRSGTAAVGRRRQAAAGHRVEIPVWSPLPGWHWAPGQLLNGGLSFSPFCI